MFKRLIIALACTPTLALLALANDQGTSPLIVFRNGAATTNEVVVTRSSNIQPPDIAFEFVPVNGDRDATHYTWNSVDGLVYVQPAPAPAPAPLPDLMGFKLAVMSDATIPQAAVVQLLPYVATLNDLNGQPALLQQAWALIKSQLPAGSPLTGNCTDQAATPILTKVESVATAHNIQLTP